VTVDDLTAFLSALDEEERIALAASGEYRREATTAPEHWRWKCEEDDEPLDPDLAIAGGEEFLGHDDHYRIGLRSVETYPSTVPGMRPLEHLALGGCEEVAPQVARHIALHDPARALREVAAKRAILAEHHPTDWTAYGEHMCSRCVLDDDERHEDDHHWLPYPCPTVRALIAIWSGHPDYRQEWRP
jgi:hypothetical protein